MTLTMDGFLDEADADVMRATLDDDDGSGMAEATRMGPEWRIGLCQTVSGVGMVVHVGVVPSRGAARRVLEEVRASLPLPQARATGWVVGRGGEHWGFEDGDEKRWYAAHPAGPQRLGGLEGYPTRSDAALACLGWDVLRGRAGWNALGDPSR